MTRPCSRPSAQFPDPRERQGPPRPASSADPRRVRSEASPRARRAAVCSTRSRKGSPSSGIRASTLRSAGVRKGAAAPPERSVYRRPLGGAARGADDRTFSAVRTTSRSILPRTGVPSPIVGWLRGRIRCAYAAADQGAGIRRLTQLDRKASSRSSSRCASSERDFLEQNQFKLTWQEFDWRLNDLTAR